MKWPLVWRSTAEQQAFDAENRGREWDIDSRKREIGEARRRTAEAESQNMTLRLRAEAADKREACALELAHQSDAERIRAEVRAQEWEAIAREIISRGAGRPRVEGEHKERSAIAQKIRDESGGDPALAAHFWSLARKLKAEGKKDEDIVGAIGWETTDPPPEQTA